MLLQVKTPTRSRNSGGSSGFDFNFVRNEKVKAIVARKRPVKATNVPSKAVNNNAVSPKVAQVSVAKKIDTKVERGAAKAETVATANKPKDVEDILLSFAKVKKPEDEASLSLNINTDIDLSKLSSMLPFGDKKKKLSRDERKERVMQRRIEAAQSKTQLKPNTSSTANDKHTKFAPKTPKKSESLFKNNPEVPIVGQRFVKPLNEIVFTGLPMNSIGLHPHLVKTLADLLGITELTNVQQRTVPVALEGRDILVRSQTGSGKTLAYALPIVHQLQEIRPKLSRTDGIRALIIVPTRELAMQTLEVFIKLLKPFTWLVPTYITGGEKRKSEKARLRKGINILIGTPGRICDHLLHTESFKLDQVRFLVLDEADRLFEMGYEKDVQIIVDALNKKSEPKNPFTSKAKPLLRPDSGDEDCNATQPEIAQSATTPLQSLLLSATLTSAVRQLAGLALKNPLFIDTCDQKDVELPATIPIAGTTDFSEAIETAFSTENLVIPETVSQNYILVPPKLRLVTLSGLIATETSKAKKSIKMLVFLATENLVDYHYDLMTEALTKKVLDSDDEDDDGEGDSKRKELFNDSDSEFEDIDDLIERTKQQSSGSDDTALLGDVRFFK